MSKRGLFIDLDGTLADSLEVMRDAYGYFLAGFGKEGSEQEFAALNGPPLDEVIRRLKQAHGLEADEASLLTKYLEIANSVYQSVPPMPGAWEVLVRAKSLDWKTALVTSNSGALAREWLQRTGLAPLIDLIVDKEAVQVGKPDPEPYLLALQQTGCAAAESIAIEDSEIGLASCSGAGLPTFAFAPSGKVPRLPAGARIAHQWGDLLAVITPLRVWPLDSQITVNVLGELVVPAEWQPAIETVWETEQSRRPLFNGPALSFVRLHGGKIEALTTDYKTYLAQRQLPDLAATLGIRLLAVSGVVCREGAVLIGLRSATVTQDPGRWECVPSGGLSQPDLGRQLLEELQEEWGLAPSGVANWKPFALVEDVEAGVLDIGLQVDLAAGAEPDPGARSAEYECFEWLDTGTPAGAARVQAENFSAVSRELLLALGPRAS